MSLRQRPSTPLIPNPPSTTEVNSPPPSTALTPQSALSQALQNTAHLANLLPTGTLLAFQLLTPIVTHNGACDAVTQPMALILLITLAASCFLASFTDSVKGSDGHVYYGFVTVKGLWLFETPRGTTTRLPDLGVYKLSFLDFVHAVVSVLVFSAVALRDKNAVGCFYPKPGREAQQVLDIAPVTIGLVSSFLFVVFPSRRHGIGYPVTRDR